MMLRSIFALCFLAIVMAMRRPYSYPPYSPYSQYGPKQSSMMQQPAPCPTGWKAYQNSCYYYETQMLNFDKAEVNCLEKDSLLFVAETNEEYQSSMMQQTAPCPSGWKAYQDSCYYYETKMLNFDKAEVNCLEKDSLLFVAETNEEYVGYSNFIKNDQSYSSL
ncbi:unnamed protein product [Cylicostephanus goldi]|uniref:C-type lectin domain-containing protein n=1 Tax=Cylicostephanus goldi TaxID=71465 RepID=A0A3P7R5R1_CYLGO|nr:unnamed protein product [Cylicostephanus goldi]